MPGYSFYPLVAVLFASIDGCDPALWDAGVVSIDMEDPTGRNDDKRLPTAEPSARWRGSRPPLRTANRFAAA
jgi:hypothetical protein